MESRYGKFPIRRLTRSFGAFRCIIGPYRNRSVAHRRTTQAKSEVRTFQYIGKTYTNLGKSHGLPEKPITTTETSVPAFQDILTPKELAARLKVSVGWIKEKRRPRCKNPIPALPIGGELRFDWQAIQSELQ